jgi:hypothetical protein
LKVSLIYCPIEKMNGIFVCIWRSVIVEIEALILQKTVAALVFIKISYILCYNFIIMIPFFVWLFSNWTLISIRKLTIFFFILHFKPIKYISCRCFLICIKFSFFWGWFRECEFSLILFMTKESNLFSKALIAQKCTFSSSVKDSFISLSFFILLFL